MMRRSIFLTLLLAAATSAAARQFTATDRKAYEFPMFIAGSFVLENGEGDIEVVGTDEAKLSLAVTRTITGGDDAARNEGMKMTLTSINGDERGRVVRTWVSPVRTQRWAANVSYVVRLPRSAQATIISGASNHIRIADMRGLVRVKNINGEIHLERVSGPTIVESANGNVVYLAPDQIGADVHLSSINGTVEVYAPPSANFRWDAQALGGDIRSSVPVHGTFDGSSFHGYVNAPGAATIRTTTLLGAGVFLLRSGTTVADSRSLREMRPAPPQGGVSPVLVARTPFHQDFVTKIMYITTMGDIAIGEVGGDATVSTGAGSVQLGKVLGECQVESNGGPLNLGQIMGPLTAHTAAGDIVIQSAREGGIITTGGGIIRLVYAGGPTRLESGGGDIVVTSIAPVSAETRSGDITITLDRAAKSQRITAKTAKGNVLLNVGAGFGADIDATILTTDPDANTIRSDFPGLSVQRDQIGGKTRFRAIGRINGGGERVDLSAENGGIQITSSGPK